MGRYTALHWCCKRKGAGYVCRSMPQYSPMCAARGSALGAIRIASTITSRSASGTVWYRPRLCSTVLHSAVRHPAVRRRYPAVVAALLRAHPSIVDTDAEGFTPVHVAAMCYGNHGTKNAK